MNIIALKSGAGKSVTLTIYDQDGEVVNLAGTTITISLSELGTITDSNITRTTPTNGQMVFNILPKHTKERSGDFKVEIKIKFSADVIHILPESPDDFILRIEKSQN